MIDQQTVDKIIETAQIVDVVSDFVSLRKRGANYTGLCPFHNDRTPSFSVSPAKNICKCFSCGKGGNPVIFVMEHEQMTFVEALRYLAKKYNIEIKERELTDEEKQKQTAREGMLILNSYAQSEFARNLFESEEGKNIGHAYFAERGFRTDIIKKFQLGYAFEQRDHFTQKAISEGYNKDYLLSTGLSTSGQNGTMADRFRGRVIFPIHSLSGKVLGFGGRILGKKDKVAKYLNSPESEIYHKSNELYGMYFARQAIIKEDRCFLVEGYTDVISMHQAGIENVVASSGTSLTQGQIKMIHRFTSNVVVLYDGDAAGIKASLRGIDLILKEGLNVKIVLLPEGEDPDSFSQKNSASFFSEYIKDHETDFIKFKTGLLIEQIQNDPIKKAGVINDIVRSISIIPDLIVRSVYVKETARMLEINEEILLQEIKKHLSNPSLNDYNENPGPANIQAPAASAVNTPMPTSGNTGYPSDFPPPPPPFEVMDENRGNVSPDMAAPLPGSAPREVGRDSTLDIFERNIIRYLVRYGEKKLILTDQETNENYEESVADFILNTLEQYNIEFSHPVYSKMIELVKTAKNIPDFRSQSYFVNNSDLEVSRVATDLIVEKYALSKIYTKYSTVTSEEDVLEDRIIRAMVEMQDAILKKKIKTLNDGIRTAAKNKDEEELRQLMNLLMIANENRKKLAFILGERIVTRL